MKWGDRRKHLWSKQQPQLKWIEGGWKVEWNAYCSSWSISFLWKDDQKNNKIKKNKKKSNWEGEWNDTYISPASGSRKTGGAAPQNTTSTRKVFARTALAALWLMGIRHLTWLGNRSTASNHTCPCLFVVCFHPRSSFPRTLRVTFYFYLSYLCNSARRTFGV